MTFLIAMLRFLICNLDRCLAVPENQPPAMLQLAKLQRAGFVFAPKRLPEPVHSVPSQPPSLPATREIPSNAAADIFESYNPVTRGCL